VTMAGSASSGSVGRRAVEILCDVTGDRTLAGDLDAPLYESGLLDSLGTVSLLVAFEETFGVRISPAEFDKERWATPRAIVADLERRLAGTEERV
jgi:D-alanine--poly(phosphoribitol) ligase subunit 2